jgi:hypothetical protein
VSNQGNRDRDQEGNVGQTGRDSANPAGTTGRHENWPKDNSDPNRPAGNKPTRRDDDEDSGLGNRTGFR